MKKVWTGHINTSCDPCAYSREGVVPANAYVLPPGRRTIRAARRGDHPKSFFLSFPHLFFLCADRRAGLTCGNRKLLFANFLSSDEFTPETILYPSPLPNCFSHGEVCLSDNGEEDIWFDEDRELIDFFFSSTFSPLSMRPIQISSRNGKSKTIRSLRGWTEATKENPQIGESIHLSERIWSKRIFPSWKLSSIITEAPKFAIGDHAIHYRHGEVIVNSCWDEHLDADEQVQRRYYVSTKKNQPIVCEEEKLSLIDEAL